MFVIVSIIYNLFHASFAAPKKLPQWSWMPEISSISVAGDSNIVVDYVLRIRGEKRELFSTMDLGSVKGGGKRRTCNECQPYTMDSISVQLIDSSGIVFAESKSLFGNVMHFNKSETFVVFRTAVFGRAILKPAAIKFMYIHNSEVPVFNSFIVEPRVDYSKFFIPRTLPVSFFDESP